MNFSLKPHQLVAHWVPGFVFLLLVPVLHPDLYARLKTLLPSEQASRGLIWVVMAFVSGQLIDCIRNALFERWRDKRQEVNWDFFFSGDARRLETDADEDQRAGNRHRHRDQDDDRIAEALEQRRQ